jgi:hypothetical protein
LQKRRRPVHPPAKGSPAKSAPAIERIGPAPPTLRDPWAWVSVLSVLPLVLHSIGAPLGEAVAEDFDFLRHNLLLHHHSLLDGGGSNAFWRPMAHQLYYLAFGPLILGSPRAVAAIHVALLALTALLLYRVLRRAWPGPWAAAAASFPLLAESTRTLISWPSHFVDLGSLLFAVIALHEASRRRMATSLIALLASLLCKELAVATALLIPFMPAAGDRRTRIRWGIATGAVTAAWAIAYLVIRRHAGLALPHHLEQELSSASPLTRLVWAVGNSLRAIFSLPAVHTTWEQPYGMAWLVFFLALAGLSFGARARARIKRAAPWISWGAVWFALASLALTTIYPIWAPNRSLFGAVGLGIALVAVAGSAHRALLIALVALRLIGFALSPGPPSAIAVEAPQTGAFMDFERLVRLQHLMADMRGTLTARFPTLPHGARVGQNYLPPSTIYALGGDHALQVWYRDTTLRWVTFEEYSRHPDPRLAAIVQYEPHHEPPVALIEPAAMRAMVSGTGHMQENRWPEALADFAAADSLQTDRQAVVFRGTVASKRALGLLATGDGMAAAREAVRALALWPENSDSRYVLASVALQRGLLDIAEAQLDTLLAASPGDRGAQDLMSRIKAARGGR